MSTRITPDHSTRFLSSNGAAYLAIIAAAGFMVMLIAVSLLGVGKVDDTDKPFIPPSLDLGRIDSGPAVAPPIWPVPGSMPAPTTDVSAIDLAQSVVRVSYDGLSVLGGVEEQRARIAPVATPQFAQLLRNSYTGRYYLPTGAFAGVAAGVPTMLVGPTRPALAAGVAPLRIITSTARAAQSDTIATVDVHLIVLQDNTFRLPAVVRVHLIHTDRWWVSAIDDGQSQPVEN
ncbi:hypothetical protein [Gordonia effusa]|nr:hypothetical protein [Gordonia effusa]